MKVRGLAAPSSAAGLSGPSTDVAVNFTGMTFARLVLAADDDQVADAALGELALDRTTSRCRRRRRPGRSRAAGCPELRTYLPPSVRFAPLILDDQVIVAVRLVGGEVAEAVAADVELPSSTRKTFRGSSCLVSLSQVVRPVRSLPLKSAMIFFGLSVTAGLFATDQAVRRD